MDKFSYLVVSKKDHNKVLAGANTLGDAQQIANIFGNSEVIENVLLKVCGTGLLNRDNLWISDNTLVNLIFEKFNFSTSEKKTNHELGQIEVIVRQLPDIDPNEPDF